MALGNARQHRDDMVLWLALQVMMTDDVALADDALQERLIIMQDRIENIMRARLGLPDRDATRTKRPALAVPDGGARDGDRPPAARHASEGP
jgi:hypothetical protein